MAALNWMGKQYLLLTLPSSSLVFPNYNYIIVIIFKEGKVLILYNDYYFKDGKVLLFF